jgi:hypothetical protein
MGHHLLHHRREMDSDQAADLALNDTVHQRHLIIKDMWHWHALWTQQPKPD